ncbi:hypothetical protein [Pelagibacterium halotolerans]|uniref:Uncharacterized protein n=1 Tax=Pelagibacterium halotolerans (strain DSM 22347 / JCM 15775 / CGMCC 1.7692 / B2) TaxID=1082931 RepID=G4RFL8_PELHB|nr:hypothetical protein [Pelagibacterium halotolerans]AEQ53020.1 hypothetical protein KKY_3027 [Pelagibacterium halotolerans B2]QJR17322.1 hypothetical protein HKM20_01930 [Pelagibacterium halotolerans]SEA86229.1 hypothetical protein SAMN05428936_1109 [Pelagibacterium halotolerans]
MTVRAATEKIASSPRPSVDAAGWLALAAAPTFALMAWISAIGTPGMTICSATPAFVPINDMALMYALMSLFHLSQWMKLLSARSRRPNTQTEGD